MNLLLALTVGTLFAAGLFMLMRRSLLKMLVGFGLCGYAVNLLVFASGGIDAIQSPIILGNDQVLAASAADPLPQALVLTAIVIGFGAQVFLLVLLRGVWLKTKNDDVNSWSEAEETFMEFKAEEKL